MALKRFSGWENIEETLRGSRINTPENAMTLIHDIHSKFGNMRGWLDLYTLNVRLYLLGITDSRVKFNRIHIFGVFAIVD